MDIIKKMLIDKNKGFMKYFILGLLLLTLVFIAMDCNSKNHDEQVSRKKEVLRKPDNLVTINRNLVNKDNERIKAYIKRRNLQMNMTQTGLWYMIYKHGNGPRAEINKYVTLKYELSLLNGKHCYSSDSLGLKHFQIGRGGVESGLEEGVLLLQEGDKARFIMPPHLAHGLIGDQDKIPARAILVYDIEVMKISDN